MQQPVDPRKSMQGARNRANGLYFESIIEAACEHYRQQETAEIEKTPEPTRQLSKMNNYGQFKACYEKKAQPDFKGTLAGGRAVAFEAKHTETGDMKQAAVSDAQARALDRHLKMGAICFVLVSFDFRLFCKVPWDIWRDMKKYYGHKYITPEEATPYRITYSNGVLDFLRGQEDENG